MLCQKGIYPYSYMTSFSRFNETSLPPKEAFGNDLTGEDISDSDYEFAEQVWTTMGCESMGEYPDLEFKMWFGKELGQFQRTRYVRPSFGCARQEEHSYGGQGSGDAK